MASTPASSDRPMAGGTSRLAAGTTALSVALLAASTLGTVSAMTVGAALHLLGLPDAWATGAAGLVALGCLVPAGLLARRVWHVERHGEMP